jgi:hypothetical protein
MKAPLDHPHQLFISLIYITACVSCINPLPAPGAAALTWISPLGELNAFLNSKTATILRYNFRAEHPSVMR